MRQAVLLTITLFLVAGCDSATTPDGAPEMAAPDRASQTASPTDDLIEGHYIVLLSRTPAARDAGADAALEAVTDAVGRKAGARLRHTYRHALTGFAAELTDQQVEELRKDPRVLSVEQDAYAYASTEGVQEYATWGLDRLDQREGPLDRAYSYAGTGSGVTAYILDTGIQHAHSEFGGRATFGADFIDNNPDPSHGGDCHGHGTHVAGTVGGGTYGVAKDVHLISVRVLGCSGSGPRSGVIAGIDWVTEDAQANDRLPAVVNMSITGTYSSFDFSYDVAIQNANVAGVHYAVAAGNADADACSYGPARVAEALTVGASDVLDRRATFSNHGDCIDLYGPGVAITSAWITNEHSGDGSYTARASGTSMASPHVAGAVALYLETNPEATPADVFAAILGNATSNAVSGVPSGTNILAYSAPGAAVIPPLASPTLTVATTGLKVRGKQTVDLTWNVTGAPLVEIVRDGVVVAAAPNTGSYRDNTGNSGNDGAYVHRVCEAGYDHCSEEVTTVFGDGGEDPGEDPNTPPSADFTYAASELAVAFTDASTDADGSVVGWSWSFGDGASSSAQHPSHTYAGGGTYTVSLTVTDDGGATGTASKSVAVSAGDPPPPGDITLSASGYKQRGRIIVDLAWSGATTATVDVYRNGAMVASGAANSGSYTDYTGQNGGGTFTHKVCEAGTQTCSNETTTTL